MVIVFGVCFASKKGHSESLETSSSQVFPDFSFPGGLVRVTRKAIWRQFYSCSQLKNNSLSTKKVVQRNVQLMDITA